MKIKLWTTYSEGYLPTARHRKLQFREIVEYVDYELQEVALSELVPAFNIGKTIYAFGEKLWTEATESDIHCVRDDRPKMSALEALKYAGVTYSTYFGRWKNSGDEHESRDEVHARIKVDMAKYLVVDGVLYKETFEPMYCIYTFGLGHNHGGTSLSVVNRYNENISSERYFNSLEFEKAKEKAIEIALGRGDTEYVANITGKSPIEVYDEKFVKRRPQVEHGEGNSLHNSFESIISGSSSSLEAGLLVMGVTGSILENKGE